MIARKRAEWRDRDRIGRGIERERGIGRGMEREG